MKTQSQRIMQGYKEEVPMVKRPGILGNFSYELRSGHWSREVQSTVWEVSTEQGKGLSR